MKHRIQEALCRLASRIYQIKYIVHGSSEEYVLPEEILDSSCSIIETTLNSEVLRKSLSQIEKRELSVILTRFRELQKQIPFNDESISNYQLIEENPSWLEVRRLAQKALKVIGYDLDECNDVG